MVEVTTFKTPPAAPTDVPLEGRTHPAAHQGRNTSSGHIGARITEAKDE